MNLSGYTPSGHLNDDATIGVRSTPSPQRVNDVEATVSLSGNKHSIKREDTVHSIKDDADANSYDDKPPPLPPRPFNSRDCGSNNNSPSTLRLPKATRPQLQSSATTAISLTDIHTQSYQDGSQETFATQAEPSSSGHFLKGFGTTRRLRGIGGSEADTASVKSLAPTVEAGRDVESLLGNVLRVPQESSAWTPYDFVTENLDPFDSGLYEINDELSSFDEEFDELAESNIDQGGEG